MKSVITCDMEGRILTMNSGAVEIFGYEKEEIIGKRRVSFFSPGEIVLQNVANWLSQSIKNGKFETETVFVKKDGSTFPAKIKVTPLYKNGRDQEPTGYCGVTEVIDKEVDVPISFGTKLIKALAITRMPFLSAVLMPCFIAAAYAATYTGASINWMHFALATIGVAILHLASNVMNDYFDYKDGTDQVNNDYFLQYSGGSRAIELGLITLEGTKKLGLILIAVATAIGIYLTFVTGIYTLIIGLAGLFLGYFYTAPPIRLVARKGIGELSIALAFGPLVTAGIYYVVAGALDPMAFLIGLPAGLLTANILLINEFPDMESDAVTGKNHLVVVHGKKKAIGFYAAILSLAFIANVLIFFMLPTYNWLFAGVSIATLLFGLKITSDIVKTYRTRELVKSNVGTIALSALASLATALAFMINF